jgi:hypothetical protein
MKSEVAITAALHSILSGNCSASAVSIVMTVIILMREERPWQHGERSNVALFFWHLYTQELMKWKRTINNSGEQDEASDQS